MNASQIWATPFLRRGKEMDNPGVAAGSAEDLWG